LLDDKGWRVSTMNSPGAALPLRADVTEAESP
jgi:hypothetical protein